MTDTTHYEDFHCVISTILLLLGRYICSVPCSGTSSTDISLLTKGQVSNPNKTKNNHEIHLTAFNEISNKTVTRNPLNDLGDKTCSL